MTTIVGKTGEPRAHLRKMMTVLQRDPATRVQQDIWFAVKAMRELRYVDESTMLRINSLLRAGGHIDASFLLRHSRWQLDKVERKEHGWRIELKRDSDGQGITVDGFTFAATVAAAHLFSWEKEANL